MRWQGGRFPVLFKGRGVVRWQGGRFPVLFKGGGRRLRPRFHLFVSDANQQNEVVCVQDIFAWLQGWKDSSSLDLQTQTVRNVAGCGSVWNS